MRTTPMAFTESLADNTWWSDYTIADRFGIKAIQDTYKRSKYWLEMDPKMFAEMVMVLNHKCWQHNDLGNEEFSLAYEKLFYEANGKLNEYLNRKDTDQKLASEIWSYLD
jgi:hypothetical protein